MIRVENATKLYGRPGANGAARESDSRGAGVFLSEHDRPPSVAAPG